MRVAGPARASICLRTPTATMRPPRTATESASVERPVIAVDVTRVIGQVLLTEFVLPFELLAVLLLVGLLGALYFARPDE